MRLHHAIVFVSDMDRSVAFYRDVLGLPLRFESPGWTEFATEGATLALHAAQGPKQPEGDPPETPPGRCRPGFAVKDLAEFHRRMETAGVPCMQPPKEVCSARGSRSIATPTDSRSRCPRNAAGDDAVPRLAWIESVAGAAPREER